MQGNENGTPAEQIDPTDGIQSYNEALNRLETGIGRFNSSIIEALVNTGRITAVEALLLYQRYSPRVERLAFYDETTSLMTRAAFNREWHGALNALAGARQRRQREDEVSSLPERRSGEVKVIIYGLVDVNGLKEVNDRIGHQAGDQLLKAAAAAIKESIRSCDIAARVGGDEMAFLILSATDDERVCKAIVHRICHALQGRTISVDQPGIGIRQVNLQAALGYQVITRDFPFNGGAITDVASSIEAAVDELMYWHKKLQKMCCG